MLRNKSSSLITRHTSDCPDIYTCSRAVLAACSTKGETTMTWTIPLVMSNLNNNPQNQYGLVGVVTLNPGSQPNGYTGYVVFTKPANAFANQQFNLQNVQYPYPNPPYQGQLYFEIG